MRNHNLLFLLLCSMGLSGCDIPLSSTPARTAGGGGYNHKVREGETLFNIAETAYNNGLEWPRLHEANPHLDPNRLHVGEIVWVPKLDQPLAPRPQDLDGGFEGDGEQRAGSGGFLTGNPGSGRGSGSRWTWNVPGLDKTLFGVSIHKIGFMSLAYFLIHALFQGLCVWITANITFVRDASIKKAMKATFMTEMLTVCTVLLLGVVGLVMVYVGTTAPGDSAGPELVATVEQYLRHPMGMVTGSLALLSLYFILSMRFIPQVFDIRVGRTFTIVLIAILLPHLSGLYLLGQRFGIIQ